MRIIATLIFLILIFTTAVHADTWQWPADMNIGGFSITGIRGNVSSNGSGNASGILQLSSLNNPQINLTRSAGGNVSGNTTVSLVRPFGYDIQARLTLDNHGLKGKGTFKTPLKPVVDASITIETSGQISGSGKMDLAPAVVMPVKISMPTNSFSITGKTPSHAQADTPLATYSFSGELKLDCTNMKTQITASGSVQRTGKLSSQVAVTKISNVLVNPNDGTGKAVIDGVTIVFDFFKR